jgi:hypothetical protein
MAKPKEIDMKPLSLKSLVVAVSLAATSAFGAQAGPPFETTQFDRILPNLSQRAVSQTALSHRFVSARASAGASVASSGARLPSSVWAGDHNFIAPAP